MFEKLKEIIFIGCVYAIGIAAGIGITECKSRTIITKANSTITELNDRTQQLESDLTDRITECEQLRKQLESVGNNLNDCLSITRQLRSTADEVISTNNDITAIIEELRKRITYYEDRIKQLDRTMRTVEDCLKE